MAVANEPGLSRMLLEAFRSVDAEVEAGLRDRGAPDLTPSQAAALLLIDRSGTHLTHLADRAHMTKQGMMQIVDSLEATGLVRRTADPSDARAKIVRLTARGLRARSEARRAVGSVESRMRRLLGERRYEALRSMLLELTTSEE